MPRRHRLALTFLTALLVALAWLPGTPWLRDRATGWMVELAADAGYRVGFAASSGNLWRGAALERVVVSGPGLELEADRVAVAWFLPALLVGELPLRVDLRDLTGDVRWLDLALDLPAGPGPTPIVRPRLDAVRVDGGGLRFADAPFTLPDLTFERIDASTLADGRWRLELDVRTPDGAASGAVLGSWGAPDVDVLIDHADARLARAWWDGVEDGRLSGALRWSAAGADAAFELRDGRVRAYGVEATDVHGPVSWRGDRIETALEGSALGGRVRANAVVDVARAELAVEADVDVDLVAASAALTAYLGAPALPAADEGRVSGSLRFAGWSAVAVEGELAIDGAWLGSPLLAPAFALGFDSATGLSLATTGTWGAGPLALTADPDPAAGRVAWSVAVGPVAVLGVPVTEARATWTTGAGPLVGRAVAAAGGPGWSLDADAVVDAEGLQGFVAGSLLGTAFQGALAAPDLRSTAPLAGQVAWAPDADAWTGAPSVALDLGGTLGRPTGRASLVGTEAVAPTALAEFVPDLDLRGGLDLVLADGTLTVAGDLGPVAVAGDVLDLGASLAAPIALGGEARGTVGPLRATWRGGVLEAEGRADVAYAPTWAAALGSPAALVGTDGDVGWRAVLDGDGWQVTLDDERWRVASPTADGDVGWSVAVRDGRLRVGPTLVRVDLEGAVASGSGRLSAGDGAVDADLSWSDGAGSLELRTREAALRLDLGPDGGVEAAGRVDLAAWGDLGGAAVVAELDVDAAWPVGAPAPIGRADLVARTPLAFTASARGDAGAVAIALRADLAGLGAEVDGAWVPGAPEPWGGTARVGPLTDIAWTRAGARGVGVLDGIGWADVAVPALPWAVEVDAGGATLALGGLEVRYDLGGDLVATVDQVLTWGTRSATVRGGAAWSPTAPDGSVDVALDLGAGAVARLVGTARAVRLDLVGEAALWADGVSRVLGPGGGATPAGRIDAALAWTPADGAEASARWLGGPDGAEDVLADASGAWSEGALRWSATGAGWTAEGDGTSVAWRGEDAEVTRLLADPPAVVRASGALARDASGWSGRVVGDVAPTPEATAWAAWTAVGEGDLRLALDADVDGAALSVAGTLTDDGAVAGTWSAAAADLVEGRGTWGLGVGGARAEGAIDVGAGEAAGLTWPAFGVDAAWRAGTPWTLRGRGALEGALTTGAVLAVDWLGRDGLVEASLDPDAGRATVRVRHPVATAEVGGTWSDWSASGRIDLGALASQATDPSDDPGPVVAAAMTGRGTRAAGRWRLGPEGAAWAAGSLEVGDGAARAVLQGSALTPTATAAWPAGWAFAGDGELVAAVDGSGWRLTGALGGDVAAAGVPLRLELSAAGQALALDARTDAFGGGSLRAAVADLARATRDGVVLSGALAGARLDGGLVPDDGRWALALASTGSLEGALEADLAADGRASWVGGGAVPGALEATWSLAAGRADLAGEISGVAVASTLAADTGASPRLAVAASSSAFELEVAGTASPVALDGTLRVAAGAPTPVALRDGPPWTVAWGGLELAWREGRVVADGATSPGALPGLVLAAEALAWDADAGWSGAGQLAGTLGATWLELDADLRGAGALEATTRLRLAERAVGGGVVRVPATLDGVWSGRLDLRLPLAAVTGATATADGTLLAAAGAVAGAALAPTVDLALALTGAASAQGRAAWDGREARVDLAGEHLEASGTWTPASGGLATVALRDVAVDELLPWVASPRVALQADLRLGRDGPEVRVDALRVRSPGSEIAGQGQWRRDGRLVASLRIDADLADVRGLGDLRGRVRGPVAFDGVGLDVLGGDLTARLELAGVRWNDVDAVLDGEAVVTGAPGDPTARASWRADGEAVAAAGTATWRPATGRADLQALGRVADVDLDVDVQFEAGAFAASGRVARGDARASVGAVDGVLTATGAGAWATWSARLDPADWSRALAGDLASLDGTAEGTVEAVATLVPEVRVDGRVRGLGVAGVVLGDLALAGDVATGWRVDGDRVQAVAGADLTSWSLEVRDLALPVGTTALDAAWRRGPDGDALEARWRGTTPAGPVDLSASLDGAFATGLWRGGIAGEALGGRLTWPIARTADGWRGTAELDGATYGGVGFLASADLTGVGAWPEVEARAAARDDAWAVEAGWVGGGAVVAVEVASPEGRLGLRGRAWPELDLIVADARGGTARLLGGWQDAPLRIEGRADLSWGPLAVELTAPNRARVRVAGVDGAWSAALPPGGVTAAWRTVRRDGWAWRGEGAWGGELLVARGGALAVEADAATLAFGGAEVSVDGAFQIANGALDWRLVGAEALLGRSALAGTLAWDGPTLALVAEGLGRVDVRGDADARRTTWALDLGVGGGRVDGALAWGVDGWSGRIDGRDVLLPLPTGDARLALSVRGDGPELALEAAVRTGAGAATLEGRWDAAALRLGTWGPTAPPRREVDLRLSGVDLAGLGGARALTGTIAGSVAVRGDVVIGQFASEDLTLGTWRTDALLSLRGDLAGGPEASVRLDVGASRATVDLDPVGLEVFAQLERFPLHDAVAAAFGPSDVLADVTGVVRGAWSWGAARPHDLRLATEHVRLERAGVVTTGNLALSWDDVALRINEARFEGSGAWSARGSATPEALDLEFVAIGADFSPLLGLVPSFARYGVAAAGDLNVRATGTLEAPNVTATTAALELGVAGTRYRLEEVAGELVGSAWSVRAGVAGVDPLGGRVDLVAGGRVGPFPATGFSLEARAVGDLDVPFLGRVTDLDAEVRWADDQPATLLASGAVGGPLSVEGTLSPLDLTARGRSLALSVPFLFVAAATADADARLVADAEGVLVSGRVDVADARVDLAARQDATAATGVGDGAVVDAAAVRATRARVRFDDVRIVAPQRVMFAESFGAAEAAVDLTLSGNAAAPRLAGTVAALRGTLRFAGRDLELTEAVATFDPTRGVFPTLEVGARTTFDKARVIPAGTEVRFTAPPGPSFRVDVAFEGEATGGDEGFALDLEPRLASDALVEGLDAGSGARPLTDLELLSLVALGRLEVTSGFAGTVAQNALDAAVDLLVTAEIQAALAEGLGLDVVELRTTPVTSLFDGGDPFGVSLRLGGYLSDEVFASYRVSTLDGDTAFGAFSNEVAFAYQLGPVAIDLTGRVDVAAGSTATAGPSLGVGASYGFAGGWSLEFGVDLATERSLARLGVTWRW
jgi:hypothetical protein